MTSNYAVSLTDFQAKLISVEGVKLEEYNDRNTIDIEAGMTLKIVERISGRYAAIQILDYYNPDHKAHESHLFQCLQTQLQPIPDDLWMYVVAILDPQERLNFVKHPKRMPQAKQLDVSKIVKVSGRPFRKTGEFFDCIIRYIGPVREIGPGHYIGLELLSFTFGESPQKDDLSFVSNYMKIEPKLALILAVNWLDLDEYELPNTSKQPKKNFVSDLLCGAKEKIKRNGKRFTDLTKSYSDQREDSVARSFTPDPVGPNRNSGDFSSCFDATHAMETRNQKRIAASVSSPNLSKQDSSSSTGSSSRITNNLNVMMDPDLRYIDSQTEDSYRSGRSSQNSSNNSTLKHSKTRRKSPKASTFRLDDRDIVIIDTTDIKEATSNESAVIIVDPPAIVPEPDTNDVDLKDVLGSNWPAAAGGTASILNTENKKTQTRPSSYAAAVATNGGGGGGYSSSSSTSTSSNRMPGKFERNKSPNPLSHLASSKPGTISYRKEQRMMQDAATMANPTDTSSLITFDNGNGSVLPPPPPHGPSPSDPDAVIQPSPLKELPDNALLEVGSMVEVDVEHAELYGVIRWIGPLHIPGTISSSNTRVMVGIELEEEPMEGSVEITDGVYDNVRLYKCPAHRGIFVYPAQCNQDRRFQDVLPSANQIPPKVVASSSKSEAGQMFGAKDCPIVVGSVAPLNILKPDDLDAICGKFKGIQGHHNSCYLDATLFSMFTFTSVFDSLLFRPREPEDNSQYEEVQRVLREEIVNPLRANHFVRADRVMKLRQLLDRLSSVTGLTSEEKDPEEFLNSLLAQILRADPFLKLSSGLDTFYYQLFVEKDDQLKLPSVQQLFEQSFLTSNIKLKEVPSCLIIQMPRFGKNFKMYPRILPSQVLDVTDIIEDSPRQCTVCGCLAEHECRDCFGMMQGSIDGLESTAFCRVCLEKAHTHNKRQNHTPSPLTVPKDFKMMADHCPVPRLFMELFAVVCIETSHYVAFVKAASGQDAPWVFFDSMADRKGEQNGYNIPEMIPVPDLPQWLSEDGARQLNEKAINDKMLPEHAKRLLCDAYMCMYQSTDVMMYR
ncbi:hypothetical protein pipiens_013750 [Culex pipiens pipiens]|uniref:ubiquitinyl hydrolase 1 n=1 Tax=Culex pipiens pipiens TaxID=38569 RepID=A0ABD1CX67_CULPP